MRSDNHLSLTHAQFVSRIHDPPGSVLKLLTPRPFGSKLFQNVQIISTFLF